MTTEPLEPTDGGETTRAGVISLAQQVERDLPERWLAGVLFTRAAKFPAHGGALVMLTATVDEWRPGVCVVLAGSSSDPRRERQAGLAQDLETRMAALPAFRVHRPGRGMDPLDRTWLASARSAEALVQACREAGAALEALTSAWQGEEWTRDQADTWGQTGLLER